MVTVKIKDHVQFAYSYEEGQKIYTLILPAMKNGEVVSLSFEGFVAVPSSFLNAALLQLADSLPLKSIRQQLRITDSTNVINDMIRRGFDTVEARLGPGPT